MGRGRRETARSVLLKLCRGPGDRETDVGAAVDRELREIQESLEERAKENSHSTFDILDYCYCINVLFHQSETALLLLTLYLLF